MGLIPTFRMREISAALDKKAKAIENAIIMRLKRLGEECVKHARTSGDYTDQTGNLRSSIGYVVMANGKEVKTNFTGDTADGKNAAKTIAKEVSEKFTTGYALIVVAGMDYAYYVEATGRNVLSGAEHYAEKQLPQLMAQLKAKIK